MKSCLATLKKWVLVALLGMVPLTASAQLWTAATPNAQGAMLALDRDNNTYVAGSTSTGGLLTKYSPSGALLWQVPVNDVFGRLVLSWVTVDPAGNPVVAGEFVDANGTPNGPFVAKYSPAGIRGSQDMLPGVLGYATRVSTDAAGNSYLVGNVRVTNASGNATMDILTLKIPPNGLREWMRTFSFDATSTEFADAMAVTAAGNVILGGSSGGQMLLLAYDTAGNQIWSKVIPGVAEAMDVVIGNQGEIYAVGGSATGGAGQGFVVVKHDANFNEIWRNTYPARGDARRAAVDLAGNLLVTGAVDTNTGLAQVVLYDWMTIKLDPNGALLWSRTYGQSASNNDVPYSMALGSDGSAYITGEGRTVTTDPSLSAPSTVTLKYAPDGTQAWVANTAVASRGLGVKLSSDGDVFVVSESPQTVFRYPQSGSANHPPTAIASADTSAGPAPLNVNFSSVGSADPDGSIASYAWSFGDGQTSTAANPSHSYVAGSYTARLTVTDNLGAARTSAPITITANASAPPPTPTALTLASVKVAGGRSTTATVRVSSSVGVTVALASSNPSVASVPASVVIPVGATSATFTVKTSKVKRDTAVTLQASANGVTVAASLTVAR